MQRLPDAFAVAVEQLGQLIEEKYDADHVSEFLARVGDILTQGGFTTSAGPQLPLPAIVIVDAKEQIIGLRFSFKIGEHEIELKMRVPAHE